VIVEPQLKNGEAPFANHCKRRGQRAWPPAFLAHLSMNLQIPHGFHEDLPFTPRLPIDEERQYRPAVAKPGLNVINEWIAHHTIGIVCHGIGRARMLP
jgi:hypothetical protein